MANKRGRPRQNLTKQVKVLLPDDLYEVIAVESARQLLEMSVVARRYIALGMEYEKKGLTKLIQKK